MAKLTPAAEAIAALHLRGWNNAQIGRALGIDSSLVRQAISPSPGQRQKPLSKYVPALQALIDRPVGSRLAPSELPGRRVTRRGEPASVREKVREFTTKKGAHHSVVSVTRAPATLKAIIRRAAERNQRLRWDIHFEQLKLYPDKPPAPGWVSGHQPFGWSVQELLDRIEHPRQQEGDTWKPGDVNGALAAIALQQNPHIWFARRPSRFNLFTVDLDWEPAGRSGALAFHHHRY